MNGMMMKGPGNVLAAATLVALLLPAGLARAETEPPYDPVARAIALGLTPEMVDAAFDRAVAEAEGCVTLQGGETINCRLRTAALEQVPTS